MKNKFILAFVAAVVVLSIATVSAKAQSYSIREEIVNKAVDRIVSLIMGTEEEALGSTVPREQSKSSTVMVSEGPIATKNSNRTVIGQVDREYKVEGFIYGTFPSSGGNSDITTATTTDFFVNNTGKTLYADMSRLTMYTSGTPSTTMDALFATSTTPFTWNTTPAPELYRYTFATTTVPGFNNDGIIIAGDDSDGGDALLSASSTIPILDGEYFGVLKKQVEFANNDCDGSICETATSSAWGLTADWELPFYFFTKSF